MKRVLSTFIFSAVAAAVFALMPGPSGPLAAEQPVKIAVLPFTINAERDLGFLREGIQDMLASRLYWKDRVEVIDKGVIREAVAEEKGPLNVETAGALGRKLGADYVLFGSLTVFGESVSMDATMASLTKQETPVTVYVQTQGMETVIPEIDRFAQKVNGQIFGRVPEVQTAYAPPAAGTGPGVSPLNPNFQQLQQADAMQQSFWKSKVLHTELRGLDIGDLDGDGKNEFVLIEGIDVVAYRWENGAMRRLGSHTSADKNRFVAVDVADINGNGRAEIFASRVSGLNVTSMVLELGPGGLKPIVENSPWLFRVMSWPGRGKILVGQKKSMGPTGGYTALIRDYFEPGVFALSWKDGLYAASEEAPLIDQKDIYIYNFAVGDLDGDQTAEVVMIDRDYHLHLKDLSGALLYESSDLYGGSLNYIVTNPEPDATRETAASAMKTAFLYIPARILIEDLDGDGRNEVIINRNKSMTGGWTERLKAFKDGRIAALLWNGLALEPIWESRKLSGAVSDYQIKDLNNDNRPDLVVGLLEDRKVSMVTNGRSMVVSYELQLPAEGGATGSR
ncbi:FG-GAP-like repeat-containing protein [Desulfatiglans anilini]|uniref:FG-GAP-like repeat-containing protein n=1 Tax=Desulfatiglans anilini TaxID=90728 RepID=UPI00041CA11A|nr:FG-GAP-like repeat-containing protein [Desulfatiglans anilini]